LRDTEGRIIKARLFKSAVIGGARGCRLPIIITQRIHAVSYRHLWSVILSQWAQHL